MTQLSSNTIAYHQIYNRLRLFYLKEISNEFKSSQERLDEYNKILNDIYSSISGPMSKYDPFVKGEPPISSKINNFSQVLSEDINAVSSQVDYLSAKIINVFNLFSQEIENEKKYSERISLKSKILQVYNTSESEDMVYYGDSFENYDLIDTGKIRNGLIPNISNGQMTLPLSLFSVWRPENIKISNTEDSVVIKGSESGVVEEFDQLRHGFLGNNHLVSKETSSDGQDVYEYIYNKIPNSDYIRNAIDSNPLSFFEFESINVDKSALRENEDLFSENEFTFLSSEDYLPGVPDGTLLNWSNYDMANPLRLVMLLQRSSPQYANSIDITPYFEYMKYVKVVSVKIFDNNNQYEEILEEPLYIGSTLASVRNVDLSKYFYNVGKIKFSERLVYSVQITFEQDDFMENQEIQHAYWVPDERLIEQDNPFAGLSRFSPELLQGYQSVEFDKYQLLPTLKDKMKYKSSSTLHKNVRVRLQENQRQEQFKVLTFIDQSTQAKYYFSKFIYRYDEFSRKTSEIISIIFSDEIVNSNSTSDTQRFNEEEDPLDESSYIFSLKNFFSTKGSLVSGETYEVDIEFNNQPLVVDLSSVQFEDVSYSVTPSQREYLVPIRLEKQILQAKRMSIGIRDISVYRETYKNSAEMVSKVYNYDTPIESVSISVDSLLNSDNFDIPNVNYYISVEEGKWIPISPIQLDFSGISEVVVFNKNVSDSYRIPGVLYLNYPDVPQEVKSVRVKIEFSKNRSENITPIFYAYQVIAKVRV